MTEITFTRCLGQAAAKSRLAQALGQDVFPHALLLHGGRGVGQIPLMLDLADLLACQGGPARPCGKCEPCRENRQGRNESLLYLFPVEKKAEESQDARVEDTLHKLEILRQNPYGLTLGEKEHVSVALVRDLHKRLAYAAQKGRRRIILFPWPESMHAPAANALLKLLEEPPTDTYFLLAGENRGALLPTILSRCVHIALTPLSAEEFRAQARAWEDLCPRDLGERLFPFCEGSPGRFLELAAQGGEEALGAAAEFLAVACGGDWRAFSAFVEGHPHCDEMEPCLRLLDLSLRAARLHHFLRATAGPGPWPALLSQAGYPPSLAALLEPLDRPRDPRALVAFLEAAHGAIREYSKPAVALIGNFLEYETAAEAAAGAAP